jgi:hypothetical protein
MFATILMMTTCVCKLPHTDIVPTATIGWMLEFFPVLIGNKLVESPEQLTTILTTVATQVKAVTANRTTAAGNPQQANRSR